MAVVELMLPALPLHVRTARMVTVAAARRAGLSGELVDELRLAVGEACARAVALHARHAPDQRVGISVTDDVLGLTVTVTDSGPAAGPAVDDVATGLLSTEPLDHVATAGASGLPAFAVDPNVSLAVLSGLVDEVSVQTSDGGTTVTMRWPLPARRTGSTAAVETAPA